MLQRGQTNKLKKEERVCIWPTNNTAHCFMSPCHHFHSVWTQVIVQFTELIKTNPLVMTQKCLHFVYNIISISISKKETLREINGSSSVCNNRISMSIILSLNWNRSSNMKSLLVHARCILFRLLQFCTTGFFLKQEQQMCQRDKYPHA